MEPALELEEPVALLVTCRLLLRLLLTMLSVLLIAMTLRIPLSPLLMMGTVSRPHPVTLRVMLLRLLLGPVARMLLLSVRLERGMLGLEMNRWCMGMML